MNLDGLNFDERLELSLRGLYDSFGYTHYRMSKFEEYDLYVKNKDFLSSSGIITFTDTNGRLMALKPDVTLSIIKNLKTSDGVQRVYYNEKVYRVSKSSGGFREIMQTGLECTGDIGQREICEVLLLALKSLEATGRAFRLDLSDMGIISDMLKRLDLPDYKMADVLTCIKRKNAEGIRNICKENGVSEDLCDEACKLIGVYGDLSSVLPLLEGICSAAYVSRLKEIATALENCGYGDKICLDLSIVNDMSYYNGIVFRGYIEGVPDGILSGGCYDLLMKKMGRDKGGIGFAVSFDRLGLIGNEEREYDCDAVLICADLPASVVLPAQQKLAGEGKSVIAVSELNNAVRVKEIYRAYPDGKVLLEERK